MPALLLLLLLSIETLISFGPWHSVSFYCRIDAPECSGARREVRCIYYWFRYIILVLCNDKYLTLLSRQIRWDFDWSVAFFFFPFFRRSITVAATSSAVSSQRHYHSAALSTELSLSTMDSTSWLPAAGPPQVQAMLPELSLLQSRQETKRLLGTSRKDHCKLHARYSTCIPPWFT